MVLVNLAELSPRQLRAVRAGAAHWPELQALLCGSQYDERAEQPAMKLGSMYVSVSEALLHPRRSARTPK
jgi:hypothetical protein